MEWHDTGFVLAGRRHGESALIVELLTREHGRHLGLVRGGQSPKLRAVLQLGNEVAAMWRGRLSEHWARLPVSWSAPMPRAFSTIPTAWPASPRRPRWSRRACPSASRMP